VPPEPAWLFLLFILFFIRSDNSPLSSGGAILNPANAAENVDFPSVPSAIETRQDFFNAPVETKRILRETGSTLKRFAPCVPGLLGLGYKVL
jgi:hypothetical protein